MALPSGSSARYKVLVPEKLSPDGLALLKAALDVDERKGLSAEDLLKAIPEYDALLVRSETKVTAAVLAAGKKLKVVARAGVGVDNVGKDAQVLKCCTYSPS
jgi:D-3-phosphoglycerate dehydrogenase / 2-oxoglutarate reductase